MQRETLALVTLEMELTALAGKHPFGFAVRLHTLGDFYSADYVKFWGFMLDALPSLHLFGFTAYRAVADDEREAEIGAEVENLNVAHPKQSFIRFSGEPGAGGSRVFDNAPPAGSAEGVGVIMCPAQTGETAACATCGLCWNETAWGKSIGFLRHGMKSGRHRKPKPEYIKKDIRPTTSERRGNELATKGTFKANSVLQCNTKFSSEAERLVAEAQAKRERDRNATAIRINEAIIRAAEAPGATQDQKKDAARAREELRLLHRRAR